MPTFRLKHSFTAGELSPLMNDRVDFERYKNGCKTLLNAICASQGPAIRRPGFKFIYSLNDIGIDVNDPNPRMVPFIFNELQAYALTFYQHTDGFARMVLGTTTSAGDDGLVTGAGEAEEINVNETQDYTGDTDYIVYYPPGSTENTFSATHVAAADFQETDITSNCTVTYLDGVATITVATGPTAEDGDTVRFEINMDAPVIPVGQIVTLILPDGWDINAFDYAQSGDELYIAQPGMTPHIIRRWSHTLWEVIEVTFTDQPSSWTDTNGWPEKVTFHQQRLAFAANKLRRQTVWMTQAGDFSSFSVNSPLIASDAVTFTLDSGTQNKIQWMASGKSLHIGTLGNEWTVTGNDSSALTPENILAQRQTNSGSEPNKPLLVGLTTLFIERHGRTVNEFVYDYTFDSYKTSDMAILSQHLTSRSSIHEWTYQQTPDSVVWCVRDDGHLLGITYQRQHKVVGWHQHDTQGEFKTITAIPGNTREDDVWTVVSRYVDGGDKYYVEKLNDWFDSEDAVDSRCLDSFLLYEGEPTNSISGVSHLAGLTINIQADGTVHPPLVVPANGVITLNSYYSTVLVGLQYISEVEPHLSDFDADGTTRGRTQRITKISVDLFKSLGLTLVRIDGEGIEHVEEIPFRVPANLMGVAVPLYTGWYTLSFPEGFSEESSYIIRQTQPLPMTIRGVVDEVEVHGL